MSNDNGSVEMALGIHEGRVMMRFKEPMSEVLFDAQNAMDVATAMADLSFECRDAVKPAGDALKAELIERHRMTLTQRLSLVIGGQRENRGVSNGKLAQQIIDIVFAEIF